MKVVGIKHAVGEFTDQKSGRKVNYDHYKIYCTEESVNNNEVSFGVCPNVYKVKPEILHQVVSPDKIEKLVNRSVSFWYDAYKNIAKVEVL